MSPPVAEPSAAYEAGSGPVLLLLHGLGGTWHIWKPVLPLLPTRYRVLALTLPGHDGGRPLPASARPSIAALVDALVDELRQRGVTAPHVAGNSLGGWLALELARRGVARSVVAFSPAGGWNTIEDYWEVARSFRIAFALMPTVLALSSPFLGWERLRVALGRQAMAHPERVEAADFRTMLRAMTRTPMLPALLKAMDREGPIAPFDAPGIPIRVVWGERDQAIPFWRYGRPVLERIPGAEQQLLPGAGHVPMYDDPEGVAAAILAVAAAAEGDPERAAA